MQAQPNEAGAIAPASPASDLTRVPIAQIIVPDGFNPRGAIEDRELAHLADSIRQHGVLQPIRVRATDHGQFVLIAGERRYRAALKAELTEVPVIVRAAAGAGPDDQDEQADLLVEAVIENDLRVDLDPRARARGYRRLLDSGLTVKGVAERLNTTQARIKEHLAILRLPECVQEKVSGGDVPLRAVKPLGRLAEIHPGLADAAASEILSPAEDDYEQPYTWADLERDPLQVAIHAGELPAGVYCANEPYAPESFELTDKARKDLAALEQLLGTVPAIRFGYEELQQARALGAAHGERWDTLIVGADVAAQLAGDYLARCLKTQRANERRNRAVAATNGKPDPAGGADEDEARREAKRAEREAERHAREQATVFNTELGRAVYSTLTRVKVDERTLKLLATVDVTGELGDLAMRGPRYGFPGWIEEAQQRNGKTKPVYIEQRAGAEQHARDFLAGAVGPGEIAGRQLALAAMAVFADQDAVAASNRSWHQVKLSGPWAHEFDELLDALLRDKLPASAIALLEAKLDERAGERQRQTADRVERDHAVARLDGLEDRIAELNEPGLAQAGQDLALVLPGYDARRRELTALIEARRAELPSATVVPVHPDSDSESEG